MTAISDRATVSLALECAARLRGNMASMQPDGTIQYLPMTTREILDAADELLAWIDSRCAERAKRDSVRANAPKVTLPNMTA